MYVGGHQPRVLSDELFQTVVLDGAADAIPRDSSHVGEGYVERQEDDRRPVDGHRRRHRVERNVPEEGLHVRDRVDRDAAHPDLSERARAVAVVAHECGEIEGGRQARLSLRE